MGAKPSKKIGILYVITGLHTGGAEIMLWNLLSQIDRERINPVVISLIAEGPIAKRIRQLGITVYCMNFKRGKIPAVFGLFKLIKLARALKPNILQGWMYHGNIAAQVIAFFMFRKIPVIWNIHHTVENIRTEKPGTQKIIYLGKWLSNLPKKIVYVSTVGRSQHAMLGYAQGKSAVIANGVDVNLFLPSPDKESHIRRELQLKDETILVGMLARYHPNKDFDNFLRAASLLQQRINNLHFMLAGTQVDYQNKVLTEMVRSLEIHNISLLGERSDNFRLIASLDILCVSSKQEASPLVLLEAMSCGVPCVSTDVGDASQIIGESGLVVPSQNPEALAEALEIMAKLSKAERKKWGELARMNVIKNHSLQRIVSEYEELYFALSE